MTVFTSSNQFTKNQRYSLGKRSRVQQGKFSPSEASSLDLFVSCNQNNKLQVTESLGF